jgi:catechol 2,3-dioxygenase-like lactoylglutathione lyase family enzyme
MRFHGYDHIDCRVRSLASVEEFYDELMPALGLTEKRYAHVDSEGTWHRTFDAYNAVEYVETAAPEAQRHFIGIIENPLHRTSETRLAFRVPRDELKDLLELLQRIAAVAIEDDSEDPDYPAIFFEDPAGTKLELTGRTVERE